jgi:murein DD-endopeptidase MepM/ murein hydrolase activator NlpD
MSFTSSPLARRAARIALALSLLAAPLSWIAAAEGTYHVLEKGETLYSVARQYGLKPEALAKANSIDEPSKLRAGTRLLIPGQDDKAPQGNGRDAPGAAEDPTPAQALPATYKVVKGDTLFSIAKSYGVELSELRAANKLGPSSKIKPGDTLKLPAGASGPKAAAPGDASAAAPGAGVSAGPAAKTGEGAAKSSEPAVPEPVKTSVKAVSKNLSWPCPGEILYLDGKAYGVIIKAKDGEIERAVTSGTVSSAGPYRGYGNVVFILSRTGHIYVYGGNEKISVRAGDKVSVGQELGRVGMDLKQGGPAAYFLVFKNGEPVDPAIAPRD